MPDAAGVFDVGYVPRAFRVGLAEGLAGRYLFSGKYWSERQDLSFDQLTTEFAALFEQRQVPCALPLCTQNKSDVSVTPYATHPRFGRHSQSDHRSGARGIWRVRHVGMAPTCVATISQVRAI
jgi:hypothetical protein